MRFPCSRKYAARARRAFTTYLRGACVAPEVRIELETAVGEAIANAIEHGYPQARWFQVRCLIRPDEIVTEVEDDGTGFQTRSAEPPPGQVRGFGFGIMRSLVDELQVLKNGRLVRFTKRISLCHPESIDSASLRSGQASRRTAETLRG
jgi:anti-sigma regulatory factor (Ser/Thr protein kinase)